MKHAILPLLLAATALAGCATKPSSDPSLPPTGPGSSPFASPREVALHGCISWQGLFPLPPGAADAHLPPGFRTTLFTTGWNLPGTVLVLQGLTCERATSANETVNLVRLVMCSVIVDPPDDVERPDANHLVVLGAATDAPAFAEILLAWGATDVDAPEVSVAVDTSLASVRTGHVAVTGPPATLRAEASVAGGIVHFNDTRRFFLVQRAEGATPRLAGAFDEDLPGNAPLSGCAIGMQGRASFAVEGLAASFPAREGEGLAEHWWWPQDCASVLTHVSLAGARM